MYKPIAKMNWLLPHIYSYKFDAQNFYLIIDRRRYMKLLDVFTSAMLLRKMLTSVTYFGSPNLFYMHVGYAF